MKALFSHGKTPIGYASGESAVNNVVSFLEQHAQLSPGKIALRWARPDAVARWNEKASSPLPHEELTYLEFAQRIRRFARGLTALGVRKGDRVIIFLPMNPDMYTAMSAVQRLGAIAVFLDSWARSHHLGLCADCVQPKALISSEQAFRAVQEMPAFKGLPIRVVWGAAGAAASAIPFAELLHTKGEAPIQPVTGEHTALVTFTTGSSGVPKGANRTHRFLAAQHAALAKIIPYKESDRDLPAFPIFSLNNLAAGVTTVLPALDLAAPGERDAALLVSQMLSEHVSCATLSPSMFANVARFCATGHIELNGLRRVVTGGAPISKDDVRAFLKIAPQAAVQILYGSTEVEPIAHIEGREILKLDLTGGDPEVLERGVCVGKISENLLAKFIRIHPEPIQLGESQWHGLELARGQVGELIVCGDHVCRDYYNNPEAFARAKIKDAEGRIWHRTGDLAFLDERNLLWIVGRIHNVIERAGEYLFPVRAEVLLKRLPGVQQAAFLGLPDPKLREKAVAAVRLAGHANRAALKNEISRLFVKNKIPLDELLEVGEIPLDARHHSKVEYALLRERLLHGNARPL